MQLTMRPVALRGSGIEGVVASFDIDGSGSALSQSLNPFHRDRTRLHPNAILHGST